MPGMILRIKTSFLIVTAQNLAARAPGSNPARALTILIDWDTLYSHTIVLQDPTTIYQKCIRIFLSQIDPFLSYL